jgi:dienelactone hydrolase
MKFMAACAALALAVVLSGASARAVSYAYDRSVPLELVTDDTQEDGGIRIDHISFRAGDRTVHAALVHPKDPGEKAPGVLFVHGLGDPATMNHTEFLADAMWLARRGVVSLLPDEPWSQADWFSRIRSTKNDERNSVAEVIALRRSLDALVATPGVDPSRLAYVGHDFGAMFGALLAGADARVTYAVFVAPTVDAGAYLGQMSALDISASLARATFRSSLLQFAAHDADVPAAKARAFADAVPSFDRTVHTYDAGHALAIDAATDERRDWLADHLGVR